MARALGLDVSNNNGTVDWPKVAGSTRRPSFAFCKVSEGRTFIDSFWRRNHAGARAAGLAVGGYHYAHPGNPPIAEADFFLSLLDPKPSDLLPVLDLEEDDGVPAERVRSFALAWCRRVYSQLGARPILYTYPFFATGHRLDLEPRLARFPLWLAHYGVSSPTVPAPWQRATVWQYTSSGSMPGVAGRCDLNYWLAEPDRFCDWRLP